MPARLVFGTADAQDAAFFTGRPDSGAERLGRYPGDALLSRDGSLTRLAVAQVTDADLAELPQGGGERRPWAASWGTTDTTVVSKRGRNGATTGNEAPSQPVVVGGCSGCEPVVGGCEPVVSGCEVVVDGPGSVGLPLAGPPASEAERAAVRAVLARTGSKSETCRQVWGFKDGRTWQWLDQALGQTSG